MFFEFWGDPCSTSFFICQNNSQTKQKHTAKYKHVFLQPSIAFFRFLKTSNCMQSESTAHKRNKISFVENSREQLPVAKHYTEEVCFCFVWRSIWKNTGTWKAFITVLLSSPSADFLWDARWFEWWEEQTDGSQKFFFTFKNSRIFLNSVFY